ncbi:hypothetical protein B9Z44_14485 [Limnohabitans curvus]|uniref:Uncharacterized protein n=1 Tax=Limnohabitans curvus TaxID=323423 RepID=A0A315EEV5_9BURK|nr:hypothetical protein [Limnohabitans curvus]PUE56450.1 hypothetical protein B9Z44_14485 [Limnohabitans curvus]
MKKIAIVLSLLAATTAMAAPLVFETDSAKVFVVRPIDQWSGDKSALESSLEAHKNKTAWYTVLLNDQKYLFGNPNVTQSASNHPITNAVAQKLDQAGFKLPRSSDNSFTVQLPVSIPVEKIGTVQTYQTAAFKQTIANQGNPDDLQGKTTRNKFIGGLLSVGTMIAAADRYGAVGGSHATLGSGITDSIYSAVSQYKGGLVPVDLSGQDLEQWCSKPECRYKEIEIRRVTTAAPDRVGQIVIAYKNGKTPEAEEGALIQAVYLLTAAGSTTVDIEKARQENRQLRKDVWAACVAEDNPACKQ